MIAFRLEAACLAFVALAGCDAAVSDVTDDTLGGPLALRVFEWQDSGTTRGRQHEHWS